MYFVAFVFVSQMRLKHSSKGSTCGCRDEMHLHVGKTFKEISCVAFFMRLQEFKSL